MPTEFSVNKRDVMFVLFEQLDAAEMCRLPGYEECNRELFEMVIDEAVKMATEVLAPLNASGDREGLKFENGQVIMPKGYREAYSKYGQGGWIGMTHDPEVGGQGLPHVLKFACQEFFAGANVVLFLTGMLTEGAAHLLEKFADRDLKTLYCDKMFSGQWAGTMCLTEPSAGSDVGNLKTQAKKAGDHYLIQGSKIFISGGDQDITTNIVHQVLARLEGAPAGTKGISLFCVPKYRVAPDGSLKGKNDVDCGGVEHKMGIHASPTCTLNFGDEGDCQGYLIGEPNTGMRLMFQMMNESRLAVAMQGLGLAAAGYLSALGFSKERIQGAKLEHGKDPQAPRTAIVEHPDIRRMLIKMKSLVDGMRSLIFSVGKYIDLSQNSPDAAERKKTSGFVDLLTPICKAYGSDMGFRVNEMAVQVFGGYGYCQEYPVEQYLRDQKIASIYEGTNGIQAIDLLMRKVVGDRGGVLNNYLELIQAAIETASVIDELEKPAAMLRDAVKELGKVTDHLLQLASRDVGAALLHAFSYLEMFGHVAVAYNLLHAACRASRRRDEILAAAHAVDPQARRRLCEENDEVAFYQGRVMSALYFIHHVLPEVYALSRSLQSEDRSALDIVYT